MSNTTKYSIEAFIEMCETEIEPQQLSKILDDVLFGYIDHVIANAEDGLQNEVKQNIFYMRHLRDIMVKVSLPAKAA